MRFDLKVPLAEKDAAKKLGARWDAGRKLWYVVNQAVMAPFAKWSPAPSEASVASTPAAKKRAGQSAGTEQRQGLCGQPVRGAAPGVRVPALGRLREVPGELSG